MAQLTLQANAKINLTLGITGRRSDGYHEIDTVMQSVGLCDVLTVAESDRISVNSGNENIDGRSNIAYRAAELFFEECGFSGGADIKIEKRIPLAAGLGGGSADAAAVLIALDKIYGANMPYGRMCGIALRLGADVPFFIKGGTQRAEGIGEILTGLPPFTAGGFLLIKDGMKPSTKDMYDKLDKLSLTLPDTDGAISAIEKNDAAALAAVFGNSFAVLWDSGDIKEKLSATRPLGISLSGSGPTRFALYESFEAAKAAEKLFQGEDIFCRAVRPCASAIKIV